MGTVYRFEEYLPLTIRDWVHAKVRDLRVWLVENGILADNANSGSESKVVSAAREVYQSIENVISNKESQANDFTTDLEKDYGPDDVFRAMKGKCVEQDSGEYTYELCWMDRTTQKSKKGGGHTGMGDFTRFERMEVDEEVGADGKGLGSGERLVLKYQNGQHCWNGPNRETTVIVACAEKDEIWKIAETEKCAYRMEVGTPAACEPRGEGVKGSAPGPKDEL
jgi:protein kinase C substrate 80K-H